MVKVLLKLKNHQSKNITFALKFNLTSNGKF